MIHCKDCKHWSEILYRFDHQPETRGYCEKGITQNEGRTFPDFGCVLGEVRQGTNETVLVSRTTGDVMRIEWPDETAS